MVTGSFEHNHVASEPGCSVEYVERYKQIFASISRELSNERGKEFQDQYCTPPTHPILPFISGIETWDTVQRNNTRDDGMGKESVEN